MPIGEIWRDIPSLPGVLASSEGRIMMVPYRGPMPRGGQRPYGGTPTFGVWNKADCRFIISTDGRTYKVARLVAEAFHGSPPFEGAVVMHLDENSANNRADNLRWGTKSENQKDRVRNGIHNNSNKTHCKRGHEYDEENTYLDTRNKRACKTCQREHSRRYDAAKRQRQQHNQTHEGVA